jgi:hypothetical protein
VFGILYCAEQAGSAKKRDWANLLGPVSAEPGVLVNEPDCVMTELGTLSQISPAQLEPVLYG